MKYIDQSADELRLNIINSDYDDSELSVLTREKVSIDNFSIEYGILGASHFIKLTNEKGLVFAEVFACVEMELENSSLYIGKMDNRKLEIENDLVSYNFSSEILNWSNGSDKYKYFEDNATSSYTFPQNNESFEFLPKTQVIFKEVSGIITLETMHAYPNEDKLVFTKSKILMKEDKYNV